MKTVKVALAQISSKFGDIACNLEKHLDYSSKAKAQGADIVVFPELGLSGYNLRDLAWEISLKVDGKELGAIKKASKDIAIVCSFPHMCNDHVPRIASAFINGGEILHIYHKVHPPTQGMFEELRYFAPGKRIRTFDTPFGRFGHMICRDVWHPEQGFVLAADGAEAILVCSAIPARSLRPDGYAVQKSFEVTCINIASSNQLFFVSCNKVGFEDGTPFLGNSIALSPTGRMLGRLPELDEAMSVFELDGTELARARAKTALFRESKPGLIKSELERITKNVGD